jgi:hypothetical protein
VTLKSFSRDLMSEKDTGKAFPNLNTDKLKRKKEARED